MSCKYASISSTGRCEPKYLSQSIVRHHLLSRLPDESRRDSPAFALSAEKGGVRGNGEGTSMEAQ